MVICNNCHDNGTVLTTPEFLGFKQDDCGVYHLGKKKIEFAEGEERLLIALCPGCYPSRWANVIIH